MTTFCYTQSGIVFGQIWLFSQKWVFSENLAHYCKNEYVPLFGAINIFSFSALNVNRASRGGGGGIRQPALVRGNCG